jgi:hypothetical protein
LLRETPVAGARGLIAARREHIERLRFTAPPATNEELPELIENHLAVENSFGTDQLSYGYVTLEGEDNGPRLLSVVAMSRHVADEYRHLASQLRFKRPKLVLRAAGSAVLVEMLVPHSSVPTLFVAPLVEEIDVGVLSGGKIWYWRTIYSALPSDSQSFHDFLSAEIARTIAVAGEELPPDQGIQRVVVLAGVDSPIVQTLREAISLPVVAAATAPEGIAVACDGDQRSVGKFAPLVGLLVAEASGKAPAIDLFRTTRRPTSKSNRRPTITAIAGAAIAVLLGGFWAWDRVNEVQRAADSRSSQLAQLRAEIKKLKADAVAADGLRAWQGSSIVWLDELRDLTARFPPAGTAVVLDFSASPDRSGGAVVRLNGKAREPAVVTNLDQTLSDEFRDVLSRNFREESAGADSVFAWRFESLMTTRRRSPREYQAAIQESTRAQEQQNEREAEQESSSVGEQQSRGALEPKNSRVPAQPPDGSAIPQSDGPTVP